MDGKTSKTFTREYISNMTGVRIEKNKRNGRKQKQHIKIMNAVREVIYPEGEWRNKNGRPDKKQLIKNYIEENPETKISKIAKTLGISRTTVYKYYDEIKK
jgi:predicted transcriptional regulator YheO